MKDLDTGLLSILKKVPINHLQYVDKYSEYGSTYC